MQDKQNKNQTQSGPDDMKQGFLTFFLSRLT